jgi:hypothetical protein
MNTTTSGQLRLFLSESPKSDSPNALGGEVDPAGLSFHEYRDRCLWGPPDSLGNRYCLNFRFACEPFHYSVSQKENSFTDGEDSKFGTWDKALECGRSYLVGEAISLAEFVRRHTSC